MSVVIDSSQRLDQLKEQHENDASVLVLQQDSDHRFAGITGPDDQSQRDQLSFHRLPITRHPIKLKQDPVS